MRVLKFIAFIWLCLGALIVTCALGSLVYMLMTFWLHAQHLPLFLHALCALSVWLLACCSGMVGWLAGRTLPEVFDWARS